MRSDCIEVYRTDSSRRAEHLASQASIESCHGMPASICFSAERRSKAGESRCHDANVSKVHRIYCHENMFAFKINENISKSSYVLHFLSL